MPTVGVAFPVAACPDVVPGQVEGFGPFLRGRPRVDRAVARPERLPGQRGDPRWKDVGLDGLVRDLDLAGRRQDGDTVLDVRLG